MNKFKRFKQLAIKNKLLTRRKGFSRVYRKGIQRKLAFKRMELTF